MPLAFLQACRAPAPRRLLRQAWAPALVALFATVPPPAVAGNIAALPLFTAVAGSAPLPSATAQSAATGWDTPAPDMPAATVPLTTAVALLTPAGQTLPALVQAANPAAPVAWKHGDTRMQALQDVLKSQGLYAMGDAQGLRVYSSSAPKAATLKITPAASAWVIHEGQPISSALQAWGRQAKWTVLWQLDQDWKAPHDTTFEGDFESAASNAVRALAANGADIRAVFYPDNKTLAIRPAGN